MTLKEYLEFERQCSNDSLTEEIKCAKSERAKQAVHNQWMGEQRAYNTMLQFLPYSVLHQHIELRG